MQFGCHAWGFNHKSLGEALGTIARMGFRYVDIGNGPHFNTSRAASDPHSVATEIKQDLATFHLQLSDLYLMLPRIGAEDEATRLAEVALFVSLLPFAVALGTPGITVSPGTVGTNPREEVLERAIGSLRQMQQASHHVGLPLSFEPHLDSVAHTPDHMSALLGAVEGLQLTLDWGHLVAQAIRPHKVAHLLPSVRHVHIRQAAPMRLQTPFDQGVLDLENVMMLLHEAQYGGIITVEYTRSIGWHGAADVSTVEESLQMRDTLKALRTRLPN